MLDPSFEKLAPTEQPSSTVRSQLERALKNDLSGGVTRGALLDLVLELEPARSFEESEEDSVAYDQTEAKIEAEIFDARTADELFVFVQKALARALAAGRVDVALKLDRLFDLADPRVQAARQQRAAANAEARIALEKQRAEKRAQALAADWEKYQRLPTTERLAFLEDYFEERRLERDYEDERVQSMLLDLSTLRIQQNFKDRREVKTGRALDATWHYFLHQRVDWVKKVWEKLSPELRHDIRRQLKERIEKETYAATARELASKAEILGILDIDQDLEFFEKVISR